MVIMEMRIEPYDAHQLDAVIRLSLRAWTPVFDSIQNAMDADLYQVFYPDNWRVSQQKAALGCLRCGRHKCMGCDRCGFHCGLCSRETTLRGQHG